MKRFAHLISRAAASPQAWRGALAQGALAAMALWLLLPPALAQSPSFSPALSSSRYRSGEEILRAFAPVSALTRYSIVKLNVDGETVALGTVVDTNGLAMTKASELKPGKLTACLATGAEVEAELLGKQEDDDVALVQVHAKNLKPIQWASKEAVVGQWAVTPGLAETPHAVGIISALPRRIRPQRAYLGVQLDLNIPTPTIGDVLSGLGAEKAGLKAGDVILAVNREGVTNREQFIETLREFRAGQTISVRVQRSTNEFEAQVRMMAPGPEQLGRGFYFQQRLSRMAGEVSERAEGFDEALQHDTVLEPWLCGGPLVNIEGKAIGLNIARAGRVASYALPAELAVRILDKLKQDVSRRPE